MPMGGEAASANSLKLGYKPVAKMLPDVMWHFGSFWSGYERFSSDKQR